MNNQPPNQGQQIPYNVEPSVLKGLYTNNMQVSHTKEEFILDFMSMSFNPQAMSLIAKIFSSPAHFKRMVAALSDNLKKYEDTFGKIESPKPEANTQASESSKFGF